VGNRPGFRHTLALAPATEIVPLGSSYIEQIAVVDLDEVRASPPGSLVRR
jgi:hypothetical protein